MRGAACSSQGSVTTTEAIAAAPHLFGGNFMKKQDLDVLFAIVTFFVIFGIALYGFHVIVGAVFKLAFSTNCL